MLLDKHHSKCLLVYWATSDRVPLAKLKGHPFNMSLVQVCALASESSEEDMERFYELLDDVKQQCMSQERVLVMGDFIANIAATKEADIAGEIWIQSKK